MVPPDAPAPTFTVVLLLPLEWCLQRTDWRIDCPIQMEDWSPDALRLVMELESKSKEEN